MWNQTFYFFHSWFPRYEVRGELEHEAKVTERGSNKVEIVADKLGTQGLEAKNFSSMPPLNLSHDVFGQTGKAEEVNRETSDPVEVVGSPRIEQHPDSSVSDVQVQVDSIMDQQACKSSPGESLKSHMTL
ncbi:hypothetical protein NE237_011056 [Protea cynaroides]|uniref:Uncharacterized protein n=1 Tax=Protea cynaroides TaxID=273540 RepID=A0A9Q0JXX9_9MAGN|nr:hypothetical protein NE237_011056 [Protea cynaroides]